MAERITFAVLISIDSSEKLGATSVYGVYELESILRAGARTRGYENVIVSYIEAPFKVSEDVEFVLTAAIE